MCKWYAQVIFTYFLLGVLMPLPYQATPPLVQNGVVIVQGQDAGGASGADCVVSWSLQGHWHLNQTGYAAIFSQISSYFATRPAFPIGATPKLTCDVNDFQGRYSVDRQDLQTQATDIFNILVNTANISGSN